MWQLTVGVPADESSSSMDIIACPHCKSHRVLKKRVPRDVVAVMPCPQCHELAVYYRDTVIALNRRVLMNGTREERRDHLAEVIAEFLDAGLLPMEGVDLDEIMQRGAEQPEPHDTSTGEGTDEPGSITQKEVDKFTRIDLQCIDDATYFRKHFG